MGIKMDLNWKVYTEAWYEILLLRTYAMYSEYMQSFSNNKIKQYLQPSEEW
jgi:hypothetical protein